MIIATTLYGLIYMLFLGIITYLQFEVVKKEGLHIDLKLEN